MNHLVFKGGINMYTDNNKTKHYNMTSHYRTYKSKTEHYNKTIHYKTITSTQYTLDPTVPCPHQSI